MEPTINKETGMDENDTLRTGYSSYQLIDLIKIQTMTDLKERDKWWVVRFETLMNTLEKVNERIYPFIREELNKTRQRVSGV